MSGSPFPDPDALLPAADAAAAEAMRAAGLAATALGTATDHMRRQADGEAKALARLFAAQRLVEDAQEALQRAILGTLRNPPAEAGPHAAARRRAMARIALEAALIAALDLPPRWTLRRPRTGRHLPGMTVLASTALAHAPADACATLKGIAYHVLIGDALPDSERALFLERMARRGLTPVGPDATAAKEGVGA